MTVRTIQNFSGNPGPSGANQTWDFSNPGIVNVISQGNYISCQASSFCDSNPGADIVFNDAGHLYEAVSDSGISVIGSYTGPVSSTDVAHYIVPEKIMYYPLNYGDADSSSWRATVIHESNGPAEPGSERSGYTTVKADGYGTLITPAGTFPNAVRVRVQRVYMDSTLLLPSGYDTATVYSWYQQGNPNFLLSFGIYTTKNVYGQSTIITTDTLLQYTDSKPTSIHETQQQIAAIYPNPAKDLLTVRLSNGSGKVSNARIINVLGQVVASFSDNEIGKSTSGIFTLNVEQIPSGLYWLQVQTSAGTANRKIEIMK